MPYLTSAEFSEIVAVADTIMHHLRTSGWQFVPAPNVGAALTQSRLAKTTITLKAVRQPFDSVQHIEANSGILLDIPNLFYTPSSATPQRVADIRRVILGALVHEFIHRLQDQESPSVFAVQLASQNRLQAMSSRSPDDWFDLYIGLPLELEARAGQAAAEAWCVLGAGQSEPFLRAALSATEVWSRTQGKISGATSPARVAGWWGYWEALAWESYRRF